MRNFRANYFKLGVDFSTPFLGLLEKNSQEVVVE